MIRAVLFDRDGTLVENIPEIVEPTDFVPMPGAEDALERLRRAGLWIGVVTNQPRVGRRKLTIAALHAQHEYLENIIGKIDAWFVCAHVETADCACRKPAPGLILQAAAHFSIASAECVVIGDIASDVIAAERAGAVAILVPNAVTLKEEIASAPFVAATLADAVDAVLNGAFEQAAVDQIPTLETV